MVAERFVDAGLVVSRRRNAPFEVGVDVAEAPSVAAPRIELIGGHLLDVEDLPQAVAESLLLGGVVGEAGDQAVGGEDREAGVLE